MIVHCNRDVINRAGVLLIPATKGGTVPIIFAADLYQRPDDYESPAITHDDPEVMRIARALMNTNPEHDHEKPTAWEYQHRGAAQDSDYYAEPYKHTIAQHIEWAVELRDALEAA